MEQDRKSELPQNEGRADLISLATEAGRYFPVEFHRLSESDRVDFIRSRAYGIDNLDQEAKDPHWYFMESAFAESREFANEYGKALVHIFDGILDRVLEIQDRKGNVTREDLSDSDQKFFRYTWYIAIKFPEDTPEIATLLEPLNHRASEIKNPEVLYDVGHSLFQFVDRVELPSMGNTSGEAENPRLILANILSDRGFKIKLIPVAEPYLRTKDDVARISVQIRISDEARSMVRLIDETPEYRFFSRASGPYQNIDELHADLNRTEWDDQTREKALAFARDHARIGSEFFDQNTEALTVDEIRSLLEIVVDEKLANKGGNHGN